MYPTNDKSFNELDILNTVHHLWNKNKLPKHFFGHFSPDIRKDINDIGLFINDSKCEKISNNNKYCLGISVDNGYDDETIYYIDMKTIVDNLLSNNLI